MLFLLNEFLYALLEMQLRTQLKLNLIWAKICSNLSDFKSVDAQHYL